jgi:chloride channel 7
MTISITVLVMEGCGALQLTGPLMVAVFVAKMVGDALTPSIYDVHIKIRGAPVLVSSHMFAVLAAIAPLQGTCW